MQKPNYEGETGVVTSLPLNKAGHGQPWPRSGHLLSASSLTMQVQPKRTFKHF